MADEAKKTEGNIYQFNTPAIMGHPHVLEPVAFKGKNGKAKGDPMYSGIFVFKNDHPDLGPMKQMIIAAAKAKWPDLDIVAEAKAGKLKLPFSSGDRIADKRVEKLKAAGKEDDKRGDFQRGCTVFKSSSAYPPGLGVVANGAIVEITSDNKVVHKDKFFFGTQVLGRFNFKAYDAVGDDGKPGVKAYLDMVLTLNKGERLSGRTSTAEAFKGVAGLASTEDPTGGDSLEEADGF